MLTLSSVAVSCGDFSFSPASAGNLIRAAAFEAHCFESRHSNHFSHQKYLFSSFRRADLGELERCTEKPW